MNHPIDIVLNLILFNLLPFLAVLFFVYLLYLFLKKCKSENFSISVKKAFPTVFISFGTFFSFFAFLFLFGVLMETRGSRPRVELLMGFLAVSGGVFLILLLAATVQSYKTQGAKKTFFHIVIGASIGITLAILAAMVIAVL